MFGNKKDTSGVKEVPQESWVMIETKYITLTFQDMTEYKAKDFYDKIKTALKNREEYVEVGNEFISLKEIVRLSVNYSEQAEEYNLDIQYGETQ